MKTRDLELLSAYLDGALSPEQVARLELQLKTDPQLRAEFEALQQTRALLRQMPRRRAPRNFTLSPRQVASRPPMPRLYPFLQWSTALTMLFLALSLGLQFVVSPALRQEAMMPAMRAMSAEEGGEAPPLLSVEMSTPLPESAQPGILALPTSTPEPVQPGILALPEETPVPKAALSSTPTAEAVEQPAPDLSSEPPRTPVQPLAVLPILARLFALLIVLELASLWFLRWRSRRRWQKWS